jgi:hypothetical protein
LNTGIVLGHQNLRKGETIQNRRWNEIIQREFGIRVTLNIIRV